MKSFKYLITLICALVLLFVASPSTAQIPPKAYMNLDWQIGIPMSGDFADETSGWGMNLEGGYFVCPTIAVGAFLNFQTNLSSVDRQTLDLGNGSALTTNQKHSIFQLPFGVTARKLWRKDHRLQPYFGMKMGACYSEVSSYYYIVQEYDNGWGFYLSPEIGATMSLGAKRKIGIHMAMFYSYATNGGKVLNYSVDGLSNLGFRMGIAF